MSFLHPHIHIYHIKQLYACKNSFKITGFPQQNTTVSEENWKVQVRRFITPCRHTKKLLSELRQEARRMCARSPRSPAGWYRLPLSGACGCLLSLDTFLSPISYCRLTQPPKNSDLFSLVFLTLWQEVNYNPTISAAVNVTCDSIWLNCTCKLVNHLPAMQETWVRFLDWEDPLEKEMATHSSILAWRIPWTEEPGGIQSTDCKSRTRLSD